MKNNNGHYLSRAVNALNKNKKRGQPIDYGEDVSMVYIMLSLAGLTLLGLLFIWFYYNHM